MVVVNVAGVRTACATATELTEVGLAFNRRRGQIVGLPAGQVVLKHSEHDVVVDSLHVESVVYVAGNLNAESRRIVNGCTDVDVGNGYVLKLANCDVAPGLVAFGRIELIKFGLSVLVHRRVKRVDTVNESVRLRGEA